MTGRRQIQNPPNGEKTLLDGTEEIAIAGDFNILVSTIATYLRTLAQTLTNKTIALGSNTVSGTTAQFNTANTDGDFATLAGSETLTNKTLTSPAITTPTITGAITFPDNTRQTFNPGADAAGLNVGSHAGDPGTPSNGDLWYDSTAGELTARIAGASVALGAGGGGSVATDTLWDAKGDLAGGTGANTAARLAVGTNGHVLTADSAETTGLKWAAVSGTFTDYSATSTVTGWAATPTTQVFISKIGRQVTVQFYISGTSNATTASFTVPDIFATGFNVTVIPIISTDNGTTATAPGRIRLTGGSATIALDKAANASNGWTTSGTKTIDGTFVYMTD